MSIQVRKKHIIAISLSVIFTLIFFIGYPAITMIQDSKEQHSDGIFLLNEKGKIVKRIDENRSYINIRKNNMMISGTSKCDITIVLGDRVDHFTLNGLDQGVYKIDIFTSEKKDIEVKFKKDNVINVLYGFKNIDVNGYDKDDSIILTEELGSEGKMNISSGIIRTVRLSANGGMSIINSPRIYVESNTDEDFAILEVMKTLNIDLDEYGLLHIKNDLKDEENPAYIKNLKLGKNTKIISPRGGYLIEDPDDKAKLGFLVFFNEDGTVANEVEIRFNSNSQ